MMDSIPSEDAVLSAMALGAPAAPPIALLHGLVTGNMASWYSSVALPLSATHRVLLYDLRGHGGSTVPAAGFDLPTQARDLDHVLRHYGLAETPVDLVGHSVGALIALHFALRNPARVRRLVLVDAPMPAATHVAPTLRATARETSLHGAASAPVRRRDSRLRRRLTTLLHGTTLLDDVSSMQSEPADRLTAFLKPVSLVYGTRSPCREAGIQLKRLLPLATLTWLESGHELPTEVPQALLACILDVLSGANAPMPLDHQRPQAAR